MNYKHIHDSIIENAKNSNRTKGDGNYYEAHHIIPKCMGGEGKYSQWRTHPNIVLLTAKEHFIIHKLLCEIYPNNHKLITAYWRFVNGNQSRNHKGNKYYNIGAKEYERVRILEATIKSESNSGKGNPMFNKNHSDESREKISKGRIGKYGGENNPNFGKGLSGEKNGMFGKKHSEETKQKIRESKTGENNPNFGKKHSEETLQKMREIKIGKKHTEEALQKMRENRQQSKKVICSITNKIYVSIKEAAKDNGINYGTLKGWLRNNRADKSSLRYL